MLKNKVAIVTGGTSGIGKASVEKFVEEGAFVYFTGRNVEKGKKIVENLNGNVVFVECDAKKEEDIRRLTQQVLKEKSKVDVIFNNAGVFFTGDLLDTTNEIWDENFDVNVKSSFLLIKLLLNSLKESNGVIINNASVAGMQSYAKGRSFAYSSSKAALIQFSRMLALNYGKYFRTNCICPGIIDTDMFSNDVSVYNDRIPLGYVAKPVEVAKIVAFLASDDAKYINGAVIPIDGGASL